MCGIWLACVFSYAMLNNDLAYKGLADYRQKRVRRAEGEGGRGRKNGENYMEGKRCGRRRCDEERGIEGRRKSR